MRYLPRAEGARRDLPFHYIYGRGHETIHFWRKKGDLPEKQPARLPKSGAKKFTFPKNWGIMKHKREKFRPPEIS